MSDGSLKNETAEMEGKTKTLMKTVKELFVKRDKHEYSNDENLDSIKRNIFQHAHRGHRKKIMKRLLNPTIEDITELYASSEESIESALDKESTIPFPPENQSTAEPEANLKPEELQLPRNKTVTILKNIRESRNSIKNNADFSLHPSKDVLEKHCQKDIFNPVPRTTKHIRSLSKIKSDIYEYKSSDQKDISSFQSLNDQDFLYDAAYKQKNNNGMSPSSSYHHNNDNDKDKESFALLQNTQMLAPFFDNSGKELTPVFEISDGPDYFETLKIVESEKRHQKKYYKTLVAKGVTNFLVETENDGRIKNQENLIKELPIIPKLFRRKSLESTGFLSIDHRESTSKTSKETKSVRKTRQTMSYKQVDLIKPHQETLETPEISQDVSDQNSEAETNLEVHQTDKTEVDSQNEKLQNMSSTHILAASTPKKMPNVSFKSNSEMCDAKISDSISTDGDPSFEIICSAEDTKKLSVIKSCIARLPLVLLPEAQTKESSSSRKSDISSPARLESFVENVKSTKEGRDPSSSIFSTSEEDCQSLSLAFTPTAIKKSHSETSDSIQLDQVEVRPESVHKMLTLQQEILGLPSKYNDPNRYGAFDLVKLNYQGMEKYLRYQVFHHLKREQRERRQARRKTRAGEPSVSLSDSDQQEEQEEQEEVETKREERKRMMMMKRSSHSSSCSSLFPKTTTATGNGSGAATKRKLAFGLSICDHMKTCFQLKMLKPNWLVGFCWKKKSAVAPETTSKSQKLSSQFQSCSSTKSGVGNNNKDGDDDDSGDDNEDEDSTMSRSTNRRRKELQSMIEGREVTDSSYSETYESESDTLQTQTMTEPKEEATTNNISNEIKGISKNPEAPTLPSVHRSQNQNKSEDETKNNLQEEFFNHGSSSIRSSANVNKERLSQSPRGGTTEEIQSSNNENDSTKKNEQTI